MSILLGSSAQIAERHQAYREAHAAEFTEAEWIPLKEASRRMNRTSNALGKRILHGQWPLGHADLRDVPMQPRPAWFVTVTSIKTPPV